MLNRDMVNKYGIKYFYDITDRSDFRANPDYKGVCHVALAQEGHCKPGTQLIPPILVLQRVQLTIKGFMAAAGLLMVS